MLWNIIRDFFVNNVFGGTPSTGNAVALPLGGSLDTTSTLNQELPIGLGDWLSTTATIIVLCALTFALAKLVVWLVKFIGSGLQARA